MLLSVLSTPTNNISNVISNLYLNPYCHTSKLSFWGFTDEEYIKKTSVIHAFFDVALNVIYIPLSTEISELDNDQIQKVSALIRKPKPSKPISRLYIILVESFENWSISKNTTPNIFDFINNHDNILYCTNVKKQTKGGTSGDGQMIINTGLLPIDDGAVSFRYPTNKFPSLSELYKRTALINPGDISVWNQKRMSEAYRIHENFVIEDCDDEKSFQLLELYYSEYDYLMTITMASHSPFIEFSTRVPMKLSNQMPIVMRNYINCVHYTDSCMGKFLSFVDKDSILSNSTIVITGDHTVFDKKSRDDFHNYCIKTHDTYNVLQSSCPLVIYSPNIRKKVVIQELSYQMDIFPTILTLIGCDSTYYWRGFGRNLLDNEAKRPYNEEESFKLSDKIIRSNYFSKYLRE